MLDRVPRNSWNRLARLAGTAVLGLNLCGCASFWEEVTSRNFKFKNLFTTPDPVQVLLKSNDGDERAQALRALKEPKQNGGSDEQQDMIVKVLLHSAKSDPQPLCRLAAIDALGRFQDPRAVQGLIDALLAVKADPETHTAKPKTPATRMQFTQAASKALPPETTTIIQCEILRALGETRNPAAVEWLARIARPEPLSAVETSEQEREQVRDIKIAAVRALGNFKHYQAPEALVAVLQHEKDVALRDRAVDSLEAATGKHFGDDAKAWEGLLHQPPAQNAQAESDWKVKLVGWFSPAKPQASNNAQSP